MVRPFLVMSVVVVGLSTYMVASGSVSKTYAIPPVSSQVQSEPLISPVVQQPVMGISVSTTDDLDRFIAATGTRPEVVDIFEAWSEKRPLQRDIADTVANRGARLSITWEPWESTGSPTTQPDYTLASIINGSHDSYIDMYAASIKQYPHTVTIRLMHEMNGSWYPWGVGVNGNQLGEFVLAWQHVQSRFTALGVTNVDWMWAPNAAYTNSAPLVPLYPGDANVDSVGLSNYNWGASSWSSFSRLFPVEGIFAVKAVTSRPLWITETASSNDGGSKAEWITQMMIALKQRSDIVGVIYFDHVDQVRTIGIPPIDWRIEISVNASEAWQAGFVSRRYQRNGPRFQ